MPFVRSFDDFAPPARFDGLPFTQAQIQEAVASTGPWTTLETKTLTPVDSDPANPQLRDLTTALATLETGWYRINWRDAAGATFPSDAVQFPPPSTGAVTLAELKQYLDITKTNQDALLTKILNAVSAQAERYTARRFTPDPTGGGTTTKTVRPGPGWADTRMVRVPDIRSITTLKFNGQTIASGDYRLIGTPATWLRVFLRTIPAVAVPSLGDTLEITGQFGFSPTPDDVKDAILAMAARRYRERDAAYGDTVELPDGQLVNYFRQLPPTVKAILDSYRITPAAIASVPLRAPTDITAEVA